MNNAIERAGKPNEIGVSAKVVNEFLTDAKKWDMNSIALWLFVTGKWLLNGIMSHITRIHHSPFIPSANPLHQLQSALQ